MKATTLAALALTLLMLLLVLLAAFFFVFQHQLTLRDELADTKQTVDSLETDRAMLEIEQSKLLATATSLSSIMATSESENVELNKQLVETDLQVTKLAKDWESASQQRDVAVETRDYYAAAGPLVTIIEPLPSTKAIVGETFSIVIVASDVDDVKSINLSINNQFIDLDPVTSGKNVVVRHTWTPESAGRLIITVTAVNGNNITSQPAAVTVPVLEPTPTNTPVPTSTSTPGPQTTPTT